MEESFILHPRLTQDCLFVGDFALSRLLMLNDMNYPWFILVPRLPNAKEIFQLSYQHQHQLLDESTRLSRWMEKEFKGDKLNIAAIGNIVSQLHLHHISRYKNDKAWPAPVWGAFPATPFVDGLAKERVDRARKSFNIK